MILLRAGRDYPRSVGELLAWFATDADCRDYLAWLRWPGGFVCDECGHTGGWQVADGRWKCARCSHRTSVTAGTIFDRTRTPLTVWFTDRSQEYVCEETGDEVVLMKDRDGHVIGFEKLNFSVPDSTRCASRSRPRPPERASSLVIPLQEFARPSAFDGLKQPQSVATKNSRPRFSGAGCDRLSLLQA